MTAATDVKVSAENSTAMKVVTVIVPVLIMVIAVTITRKNVLVTPILLMHDLFSGSSKLISRKG